MDEIADRRLGFSDDGARRRGRGDRVTRSEVGRLVRWVLWQKLFGVGRMAWAAEL